MSAEIKGANVTIVLFERRDAVSDKLLIDGYIRSDSYYPPCIYELIYTFYPNGIETGQSEDDLGSVMFAKEQDIARKYVTLHCYLIYLIVTIINKLLP